MGFDILISFLSLFKFKRFTPCGALRRFKVLAIIPPEYRAAIHEYTACMQEYINTLYEYAIPLVRYPGNRHEYTTAA